MVRYLGDTLSYVVIVLAGSLAVGTINYYIGNSIGRDESKTAIVQSLVDERYDFNQAAGNGNLTAAQHDKLLRHSQCIGDVFRMLNDDGEMSSVSPEVRQQTGLYK